MAKIIVSNEGNKGMKPEQVGFLLGFLTMVILGPLLSIWALNTLFNLGIAYALETWAAMAWFHMLVVSSNANKK